MTTRLELAAAATFDAAGQALVTFGPVPWPQTWQITSTNVATTSTARTVCSLYRGVRPAASNLIDRAPYSGNADTSNTVIDLRAGDTLTIQWTGGTPGASASAQVFGSAEGGQ